MLYLNRLVETEKISDHGLETFIEILFYSDLDEDSKAAILHDALAYLDGKGFSLSNFML